MFEICSADREKPYISSIVDEMSLWLIPLPYIASTLSSMELTSFVRFGTICGSKEPSLSLGVRIGTSP